MDPGHAKAIAEAMAGLWLGEVPATLRVLTAVSDANRDHRPHPRSRSAWELATHLATADVWFIDSIVAGRFVFDPESAKQAEGQFQKVSQVVAFYQEVIPAKLTQLKDLPAEQLAESVDFFGMMKMSRAQWIGFAGNHSVHHRGQLSAYLRAMGAQVPDIYGPSGDSKGA
ncbi:MAG: DinB family protein [Gemmatimonadota bacterium]